MQAETSPKTRLRRFANRDDLYRFVMLGLASALQRGAQFLVIPVFLATMSSDEFVRYGLFAATFGLLAPLMTANVYLAHSRLAFDYRDDADRRDLFRTTLVAGIASALVGFSLLVGAMQLFSVRDPLTLGDLKTQLLVAGATVASIVIYFFVWVFRILDRNVAYVSAGTLIAGGLPVTYLLCLRMGYDALTAAVIGSLGANAVAAVMGLVVTRDAVKGGRFDRSYLRPAVTYSFGTAVYGLSVWAVSLSGRWVGALEADADAPMAAYTLFTQVYTVILVLATVVFETFRNETLTHFSDGDTKTGLSRLNRTSVGVGLTVVSAYVGLVALLGVQDAVLPEHYRMPYAWVPAGLIYNVNMLIFIRAYWIAIGYKRTAELAFTMPIAAAATIALAFALGGPCGVPGLLAATAIGSGIQAGIAHRSGRRYVADALAASGGQG